MKDIDKIKFNDDMTLGQFYTENRRLFNKKYKNEKYISINARNPENQNEIIKFDLPIEELEELKKISEEYQTPFEEFNFIAIMSKLVNSDLIPDPMMAKLKVFVDRHMRRLHKPLVDLLDDALEFLTIEKLKEYVVQEKGISINKLDEMEILWRREFNATKLSDSYKNEENYVKMKLLPMLKDIDSEE